MDLGYLEDGLWKAGGLCIMGMYVPTAQFERFGLYLASLFFCIDAAHCRPFFAS